MKTAKKLAAVLIAVVILCSMCLLSASAEEGPVVYGAATVHAEPMLNIRSGPGTENSIIGSVPDNSILVINDKLPNSPGWFQITYDGTLGYVSTDFLTQICTAEDFDAIGKVTGDWVNVRALPGPTGAILKTLEGGTKIDIIGVNNGWYILDVNGTRGYIQSSYVALVSKKDANMPLLGGGYNLSAPNADLAQQIVDYALQFLGVDYSFGCASPDYGFDCSGLVYYVYGNFGYDLGRCAYDQYYAPGVFIDDMNALQPGDLVFFYAYYDDEGFYPGHVGIYIGNGEFVHAPHTGDVVKIESLSGYYGDVYVGAKRVL